MNLLMITRKIDQDDWLAGHSYEWAVKIRSKIQDQRSKLFVICLEKGNTEGLDAEVFSLGKEKGNSRWQRFWEFQRLAKKLVPEVDGVFAHQNPEYAITVWPWALIYQKMLVSWYTHKAVTWKSRLMLMLSDKVLTASDKSFRIRSSKVAVVGHGIDIDKFKAHSEKFKVTNKSSPPMAEKFRVITVGRISPTKDLETLILAVKKLKGQGENIHLAIYGGAVLPVDHSYLAALKNLVTQSNLTETIAFMPPVSHKKIPQIYQEADLFVNLSQTGSLDKAVLEAMACECPVVTSNEAFFEILQNFSDLSLVEPNQPELLAEKILRIKKLSLSDRNALTANLRSIVVNSHSLESIVEKIIGSFT